MKGEDRKFYSGQRQFKTFLTVKQKVDIYLFKYFFAKL